MMPEGEWSNFSHEIYSSSSPDEEANFMALFLGDSSSLPSDDQCWPIQQSGKMNNNETSIYSSSSDEYNHFYSQGSGTNGFINSSFPFNPYFSSSSGGNRHALVAENGSNSMDYCYGFESNKSPEINMMETNGYDFLLLNQDMCTDDGSMDYPNDEINHDDDHRVMNGVHGVDLHLGREHDEKMIHINNSDHSQSSGGEKTSSPSSNIAKKRPRLPIYNAEKEEGSLRQKKNQKVAASIEGHEEEDDDDEKISNRFFKRQNSMISCYSADEGDSRSIAPSSSRSSSKRRGAIPNMNEKTRASRGSATDPQSIYARKRRERINERLKILQKLVPNGTKVDISTMLEEAVQYVKFLQLQIKLLSSDDHWMYAPIAYNGMDIGLS